MCLASASLAVLAIVEFGVLVVFCLCLVCGVSELWGVAPLALPWAALFCWSLLLWVLRNFFKSPSQKSPSKKARFVFAC